MILGPDAFMRRAKVAEHFISIALALRRLNNYFGAHALTNGIRGTLADGDILGMKVAETPDFKLFLSMEKLFNSYGSFSAYRLALRNSHGPVIPDLYVLPSCSAKRRHSYHGLCISGLSIHPIWDVRMSSRTGRSETLSD